MKFVSDQKSVKWGQWASDAFKRLQGQPVAAQQNTQETRRISTSAMPSITLVGLFNSAKAKVLSQIMQPKTVTVEQARENLIRTFSA